MTCCGLRNLFIPILPENSGCLGTGLWTPSDLIRARVRERDRARPNPSCFVFYQHYSDYAIIIKALTVA